MAALTAGSPAPDFTLPDASGNDFTLSAQRGKRVLIYFYPQADTPACNDQNMAFSANIEWFAARDIVLVGISPDTVGVLAKFKADYGLRPTLLADPGHRAIGPYGVWGEKLNYGRTYMGLIRTTILVGADGAIEHVWPNIRAKGHVERVMKALG